MPTKPLDMNGQRRSYVSIITHESFFVNFELTNADILTQFFTDFNNIKTGVKTYIVEDSVDFLLALVNKANYQKDIVNLHKLETIAVEDEVVPVKFIFCHGTGRTSSEPACLNFGEEQFDHRVWACKKRVLDDGTEVKKPIISICCLHDLVTKTYGKVCTPQLVIMMCCAGNEILEDYLSENGNNIPDILFYKCTQARRTTHHIFVLLLINLLDSDERLLQDPSPEDLHGTVKNGIITIFKIVKWCANDYDVFWEFLVDMGCISTYIAEKQQQGLLPVVSRFRNVPTKDLQAYYRLRGHTNIEYIPDDTAHGIFTEFQKLTLVSKGEENPVEQNYLTVASFTQEPTSSTLRKILHDYVKDRNHRNETEGTSHKDRSRVDLRMLLCQMEQLV